MADSKEPRAEALERIKKAAQTCATELNLGGMRLAELPPEIVKLTKLTLLDLSYNRLTVLPPEIGKLTNLTALDMRHNQLRALLPEIGKLTNPTKLNLGHNQLAALPPEIGKLTNLTALYLAQNQLTALPSEIGKLTKLTSLDLMSNPLTALPPEIGKLTKLTLLDLSYNRLTALPPEIEKLTNLTSLDVSENRLTALLPEIGKLTNLTSLSLMSNQLRGLPPEIGKLTNLTGLTVWKNQLTALPPEIEKLTNLTLLMLSSNRLTALPPEIGKLTNLTSLDLSRNRLTALPPETVKLTNLTELYLHDNLGLNIPPEILGPTWEDVVNKKAKPASPQAILDYYFRTRTAEVKRPIMEAKLILVGWGGVGKTSLRRRLVDGTFDPDEPQTHKIEITPWNVSVRGQQNANAENVKLHVWDFGGQEIMHATHRLFLTRRSLYVLVLAGRDKAQGAQDAEYWLRTIQSFGEQPPVLVVLNKQGACPFDLNRQSLCDKYPFIRGFVQTDCAKETGLDELGRKILEEVDRLPDLRTEFDSNWMAIMDAVSDMKQKGKRRISVGDFYVICGEKGELERRWQDWLLGFLHDLGVVVCFHNDTRLANDGVLDPQWVVDGIYKLLNEKSLQGRDGRVTLTQMRALLPAADYGDDDLRVLLELMEKFELSFRLPGDRKTVAVPELMTEMEADWKALLPDLKQCLLFELHFEFLPEGVLPRFIVATHDLSREGERWRGGVILRDRRNIVVVRGDSVDRQVRIAVAGPESTRRDLLSAIRREFARINGSIAGLVVQEMVPVAGLKTPLAYADLLAAEEAGDSDWPIVVDGVRHRLSLTNLLDGIEPKEKRNLRRRERGQFKRDRGGAVLINNVEHLHMEKEAVMSTNRDSPRNNAWLNGSFYLSVFVAVVGVFRAAFGELSQAWLPAVGVIGILVVIVIGAMQLRNDEQLKEKPFLELMLKSLSSMSLIRHFIPESKGK